MKNIKKVLAAGGKQNCLLNRLINYAKYNLEKKNDLCNKKLQRLYFTTKINKIGPCLLPDLRFYESVLKFNKENVNIVWNRKMHNLHKMLVQKS